VPIFGVDSEPSRNSEALCNVKVDCERRDDLIKKLLEDLERGNFRRFYRTRGLFQMDDPHTGKTQRRLSLNELFVADQDVQ